MTHRPFVIRLLDPTGAEADHSTYWGCTPEEAERTAHLCWYREIKRGYTLSEPEPRKYSYRVVRPNIEPDAEEIK